MSVLVMVAMIGLVVMSVSVIMAVIVRMAVHTSNVDTRFAS